jgi:hypothetical protein
MTEHNVTREARRAMLIGNQMRLHAWQLDAGEHIIINGEVGMVTEVNMRNGYGQTVIRYITSPVQTEPQVAIVQPDKEFQVVAVMLPGDLDD